MKKLKLIDIRSWELIQVGNELNKEANYRIIIINKINEIIEYLNKRTKKVGQL